MKKLIMLLSLLFVLSIPVIAQESVQKVVNASEVQEYVTNSDVEKLIDKYSDKLSVAIESLAETLKQPAEYVYTIIVRQQIVLGYTYLAVIIFTLILSLILFKLNKTIFKEDAWDAVNAFNFFAVITALICAGFLIAFLAGGFQRILNPEYYAIDKIMSLITS